MRHRSAKNIADPQRSNLDYSRGDKKNGLGRFWPISYFFTITRYYHMFLFKNIG